MRLRDTENGYSRRDFISRLAVGGLAIAGLSALTTGCGDSDEQYVVTGNNNGGGGGGGTTFADPVNFPGVPGQTVDVVVLNYALSLEFLEADLYRQALNLASGLPLGTPLAANPNSYVQTVPDGSLDGTLADAGYLYLRQYAYVEQAHVDFLLNTIPTIGGTPVGPNPGGPVRQRQQSWTCLQTRG